MKKGLIILSAISAISAVILLTACSEQYGIASPENSESQVDISSAADSEITFTENELEQIRLNLGKSVENNSINLKCDIPAKMCYVPETDTVFYSDKNGIFQKNGSKVVHLSDENATSLNLYDGKLYYVIPNGKEKSDMGKVYCLDLSTMKKKCIINENVYWFSVHNDKIYYLESKENELENGYYELVTTDMECDLNGENQKSSPKEELVYQNGISASFYDGVIKTLDVKSGTEKILYEEPYDASQLCIYENSIYYICNNYDILDLNSAKRIDMSGGEPEKFSYNTYFLDYGFSDGMLCFYDGGAFYRIGADNQVTKITSEGDYRAVYTCGNDLYVLKANNTIARISFREEKGYYSIVEDVL